MESARAYLQQLQAKGIGLRQAAKLAGLSVATIQRIRRGDPRVSRPATILAILAIRAVPALGQRISSYRTRQLMQALYREEFTQAALALRLGLRSQRLRVQHRSVTVRRACQIRALYRRLTDEPEEPSPCP